MGHCISFLKLFPLLYGVHRITGVRGGGSGTNWYTQDMISGSEADGQIQRDFIFGAI